MTNTINIEINKQPHPIKFGYGCFRRLGKVWKINSIEKLFQQVAGIFQDKKGNTEFGLDQFNAIAQLIYCGIQNGTGKDQQKFTVDDVADVLFNDPSLIEPIINLFLESMPKPKTNPEPTTAGK